MNFKRIIALALALFIMLSFAGCKNEGGSANNLGNVSGTEKMSAKLLYCANDTFNPYTLTTKVNMELCQLLYEPLIKLNNNFEPIYALAEKAEQKGKNWTVTLKRDLKFSDSSAITGDDVIYSFRLAKESAVYASCLKNVKSATAEGNTVTFTLNYYDPYFINLLSFPILKKDSDKIYNEDSVLFPPIGSGRYVLNGDRTKLGLNPYYYGEPSRFGTISLIHAPDSESVAHYVEVGATDFYYANTSDGQIFRMDGKKLTINQNRLIYIGVNLRNSVLKNPKVRYSISAALDRAKLATNAYYGNALPATGPLTPAFKGEESIRTIETSANTKIAIENLEEIGYNKLDNSGYRYNANGKSLEFSLLINSENVSQQEAAKLIVSQLREVGIRVTVRALAYDDYLKALSAKSFQLYLAEVKINNNFDLSELVLPDGSCAYGIPDSADSSEEDNTEDDNQSTAYGNDLSELIKRYRGGTVSLSEVVSAVGAQMPFIPVCYRSGVLFYSNEIGEITNASNDDLFMSLEN
ncbi:MAG: hypothetical protein IJ946_02180 [Clostridia bacterium]|nr:hypothetical protein [Clostridia bacterium]